MNFDGLRDYQMPHAARLLDMLASSGAALDASDTGTGKTYVAAAVARALGVSPLVICPKSTVPSWQRALDKFGVVAEVVNYEKARGVSRKSTAGSVSGGSAPATPTGPARRQCRSAYGHEVPCARGSRWQWDYNLEFAIFDEVQRCGGMTSLNSKMLIAAKRQFGSLLLLSATAASQPNQLKSLGFALGLFPLSRFRWWLLARGCVPGVFGGIVFSDDPEEQQAAMQKIHREIFPLRGARLRKEEIPGFPRTHIDVCLIADASGKAGRLADELRERYDERAAQAENEEHHLTKLTRTRQALELLKVPELADLTGDYLETSAVAIFVNYSETIDALRPILERLYHREVGVIDGRDTRHREETKQAFQANRLTLLLVNIAAGGVGIDLHDPTGQTERTSLICPCYSPDVVRQVLGRVQRDGGAFSQQRFVYFADTLEEEIAKALAQKFDNLDALNDAQLHGVL